MRRRLKSILLASALAAAKPITAYLAAGGCGRPQVLKVSLIRAAYAFYGASGWTKLNEAGDRKYGDFDFFSLTQSSANYSWVLSAQYNTQTGILTRM